MNIMRIGICVLAAVVVAASSKTTEAATINLYTENLDAWNVTQDLGDGVNAYGVFTVPEASSPFSDGNAIRVVDLYDMEKPELQGELSAPVLEPFRIDFQSFNQSPASSSSAIRFRMGNSGQAVTTESRAAFSLSWQADKRFNAKYHGLADGNATDIDTRNSTALDGVQNITMIANGALAGTYSYNVFGVPRTLNPLSYDVYINGVLLNNSMPGDLNHDDFKNGLQFHTPSSVNYNPALGIQRFGLFGSSDANTDPDVLYDNIILRTGNDILVPEPGSLVLMLVGSMLMLARRRRQP